jgi:hypothetical protein
MVYKLGKTHIFHDSFLRVHYVAILEHVLCEVDAHGLFDLNLLYRSLQLGAHGDESSMATSSEAERMMRECERLLSTEVLR